MEIKVVKLTQLLELPLIKHGHAPPAEIDDPLVAQLPDNTVCMHRRDAQRLANLLLGQRHFKRIAPCSAYDGKAFTQFKDNVGEPARGRPLPDVDNPLAKYRGIDQRVAPQHFGDVRPCSRQGTHGRVADETKRRRDQSDQIVVHPVQMQALEIRDVSSDVDRENLPLAADGRFGADAKAFDDQAAVRGTIAVRYNGSAGFPLSNDNWKCADRGNVRVIQS